MTWAGRRKLVLWLGFISVVAVIGWLGYLKITDREPTCFDRVKNQSEAGIDCGGVCELLCPFQTIDPKVHWSRVFRVTDGVYNAVAYIENPNIESGVDSVSYTFQLFDKDGKYIAERRGTTFLSTNAVIPVFEGGIEVGGREPARTFFEFSEPFVWRIAKNLPGIRVERQGLTRIDTAPKIDAILVNESVVDAHNIEVVAIVFDATDNAIGSSKTIVRLLEGSGEAPIVFTWPKPFLSSPSRIEVVPRVPLR
jgi:hypothetical protein